MERDDVGKMVGEILERDENEFYGIDRLFLENENEELVKIKRVEVSSMTEEISEQEANEFYGIDRLFLEHENEGEEEKVKEEEMAEKEEEEEEEEEEDYDDDDDEGDAAYYEYLLQPLSVEAEDNVSRKMEENDTTSTSCEQEHPPAFEPNSANHPSSNSCQLPAPFSAHHPGGDIGEEQGIALALAGPSYHLVQREEPFPWIPWYADHPGGDLGPEGGIILVARIAVEEIMTSDEESDDVRLAIREETTPSDDISEDEVPSGHPDTEWDLVETFIWLFRFQEETTPSDDTSKDEVPSGHPDTEWDLVETFNWLFRH